MGNKWDSKKNLKRSGSVFSVAEAAPLTVCEPSLIFNETVSISYSSMYVRACVAVVPFPAALLSKVETGK